ncbi:MAG TPA: type III pantothenate kinase [Usitatibacter sp.]|nr:type III pantothenate kinase [Usitatibacter sp.]
MQPNPQVSDTIFLFDAGNTRIKWAVHDGRAYVTSGAVPTASAAGLAEALPTGGGAQRALASNVAGTKVAGEMERACAARGLELRVIGSRPEQLGVRNGYRDPAQLGSDRWAALIAAHRVGPGHKLVINAGTALTVDALTADGRFLGGIIVPGAALMRRSLDRGTAGLRLTEGVFTDFPGSTPDAITTGAVQACAGAILRMRDAMAGVDCAPSQIVLSGGAAAELAGHLPIAATIRENLVLDGLLLIARSD